MRSDEELLARTREGDDAAFGELVERHTERLYRLALGLVGQAADAEDVVQETWTGAYRGARAFDGRSSVRTWLSAILARQAARMHRGRFRHPAAGDPGDIIIDSAARPAAAGQARLDLQAMLQALPPEQREVLVLRELGGLSYVELSRALDLPAGTVESRLFRARQALRERFGSYLEG